jgi:hypothetical protein
MKCRDVRAFLSQVSDKRISLQLSQPDLAFLASNGYLLQMSRADHDASESSVARLHQLNEELQGEEVEEKRAEAAFEKDTKHTHSFVFRLEGKDKKEAELQKLHGDESALSKDRAILNETESTISLLIQKKSALDSSVPYGDGYLSLTSLGVATLSDLNIKNYRVAEMEFSDYVKESANIMGELRSISEKASYVVSNLRPRIDATKLSGGRSGYFAVCSNCGNTLDESSYQADGLGFCGRCHNNEWRIYDKSTGQYVQVIKGVPYQEGGGEYQADGGSATGGAASQLWAVGIGLAKLQQDPAQALRKFLDAIDILRSSKSAFTNKLMAAEVITATDATDVRSLSETLEGLDRQLRGQQNVPEELSVGVAATIMAGRRFDGSYPLDRFGQFTKLTASFESAAILSVLNEPVDEVSAKFASFKSLFYGWGYALSEDTELASAFLSISDLGPQEVAEKMKLIVDSLKNYLEYPLVAAAIVASIPTLEANETLDLMEKASALLASYATDLQRSELVALSVRMIHGIRNEIVKEVDATAKVATTPVQFTYRGPTGFLWFYPIIIAHHSYYATFSGIGGFHPGHSHGIGGFAG